MSYIRRLFGVIMAVMMGASLLSTPAYARREVVVTHTNIAPVNKCGTLENQIQGAIDVFKLDAADAASLREQVLSDGGTTVTHASGTQYDYYTQCRGGKVVNVGGSGDVIVWRGKESLAARSYTLPSGRVIDRVISCGNWTSGRYVPPPPPPPPALPPVLPVVEVPPTIVPPPVDLPPPPEAKRYCNWRLNAVVGAELEIGKGWSRSGYGAWGVYCMHKLRDGEIGFGPAGQMAVYSGDPGLGHFNGHLVQAGVGMLRVWNKGIDLEAKLMGGHILSKYTEGDYRARESRFGIGATVAINDYHGLIDGTNRPKRQAFAGVFLPFGGGGSHSWQGNDIGNYNRLSLQYNAGFRQYLQKHDPKRAWNLYAQAGILGEIRSGDDYFSCSLRIGVSNRRETIGLHAGINACNGSIVPAIGAWYDLGTDLRLKRAERRAKAMTEDTGEGREATTTFTGRPLAATRE